MKKNIDELTRSVTTVNDSIRKATDVMNDFTKSLKIKLSFLEFRFTLSPKEYMRYSRKKYISMKEWMNIKSKLK